MTRPFTVLRTIGAGLVATALLGACAAPVPAPTPDPPPLTAPPVLTTAQDQAAIDAVGKVVQSADAAKDAKLLAPRVFGPALTMRTSQIAVVAATGKADSLTELPTGTEQIIIPTTQTWPRTSFAVSNQPQNLGSQRLVALEQVGARDQYKMWGWAQLFPGVTMPTFADPAIGSEAVAPDDKSLLMTPADAVAQYADVLNVGPASAFVKSFQEDQFRKAMQGRAEPWKTALATAAGTYSMTFALTPGERVRAVRTADGGALVMGALSGVEAMTAEPGAKVPPGTESEKAFFGATPIGNTLKMTYQDVVSMYVPPAGAAGQVQVLGMQHQLTGVTA